MTADCIQDRGTRLMCRSRVITSCRLLLLLSLCVVEPAQSLGLEDQGEAQEMRCTVEAEASLDQSQPEIDWRAPVEVRLTDENYIGAMQLAAELEKVTLIDTRRADEFVQVHIPGSLNLPGYAIKTKSWLRSHRLVLVDTGYRPVAQQALVQELSASGFTQVWILDGGLTAWIRQGGSVEGDPFKAREINRIEARDLVNQLGWPGWKVVRLRRYSVNQEITLPLETLDIEVGSATETTQLRLLDQEIRRWHEKDADLRVVLVGGQQMENWQMQRYADKLSWHQVYWVDGGGQAVVEAVLHRKRLLEPTGRQGANHPCSIH